MSVSDHVVRIGRRARGFPSGRGLRSFPLPFCLLMILSNAPFCGGCSRPNGSAAGRWIDLTHDFSEDTIYWPTSETFRLETVFDGITEDGYHYAAYQFCAAEHGGTHVDAPVHFAAGQRSVDQIPVEQLIGPAVVVDVSAQAAANRDYQVTVADLRNWESAHGRLPEGVIVLLHTGFGRYWPDRSRYLGTDRRGPEAVAELHFPGLHPEAAHWLVTSRRINAIGLDTASIDYGQSRLFETHRILSARNIPAMENLANLDRLPPTGATVIGLPMKIRGGSGAPLRIVALVPNEPRQADSAAASLAPQVTSLRFPEAGQNTPGCPHHKRAPAATAVAHGADSGRTHHVE